MKKLFLIPLMALCTCVMAWATNIHVSDVPNLKSAIANASYDTIYLDQDMAYTSETVGSQINILRSVVIDGQGHTLKGCAKRTSSGNYNVLSINHNGSQMVDVTIKNITLNGKYDASHKANKPVETRGNIHSLTLIDVIIDNQDGPSGNNQGLTIGGVQGTTADITMTRTQILMNSSSYPVIVFNPINLTMTDSRTLGYCSLYFKPDTYGGNNSTVTATNCDLDAPNPHSYAGGYNSFGLFVMQSGINGVNITLNNCGMNAQVTGNSAQGMFVSQGNNNLTINGDNSHINGEFVISNQDKSTWLAYAAGHITITGGTYAQDPSNIGTVQCYTFDEYDNIVVDGDNNPVLVPCEVNCVPDGYEVQEVKQGDITLYRVVKKAQEKSAGVMYDLNDLVPAEGEDYGNNPVSSFDLSTGTTMELDADREVTTAGYVQVSDNEDTDDPTIVKVGAIENAGTENETKIDQTLIVNNGLDVSGESQVIVQAGSTLQIGEGGIITQNPENIIIEADKDGAASLLLDPTITVNQTPNLTVRMTAKQIGKDASGDYYWHRFAMPVNAGITSWEKEGALAPAVANNYPTYLYGWDYANNEWLKLTNGVADMVPLQGYTLTLASDEMPGVTGLQDVTYIFKGNLVGNTDQALNFQAEGFNFFGNSYTGYMDVLSLIQGIESNNVEGTVYMWNTDAQSYEAVSLYTLQNKPGRLETWQKEVAPMQTFILRLRGADSADESVNYASAIWGNPRYGNAAPAPARRTLAASNEEAYMEIIITAANGKSDRVNFTMMEGNSDAFESGYDAVKYMNERRVNIFSTVAAENLSSVVTDNVEGKTISLSTQDDIRYTLSFRNVEGEAYAIRDNITGAVTNIAEGNTYDFTAQPNTLNADRFSIVAVRPVTTGVENVEAAAKAQGIYTVLGQYIGAREMWNSLPAGVYVVDGVKLVK